MKQPLTILISTLVFTVSAQSEYSDPWFVLGKTNIIFGANEGSHTNLTTGKLNLYTSVESALSIKNIPFNLSGRFSTEKFISGKPSFFRLSYDGYRKRGYTKRELEGELIQTNSHLAKIQDSLYLLEGKLAYLKLKKQQLENSNTLPETPDYQNSLPNISVSQPEINGIGNGTIPSIGSENSIPDPSLQNPDLPQLDQVKPKELALDSLNSMIDNYSSSLGKINEIKDSLTGVKELYIKKINSIDYKSPNSLLGGIDKLDLGLTTMSNGGMSNNSIPIQGIRVKGKYQKSFYDVAAGTTVPNRIFTNSVYDQITNNTQNVFNLNQFFTVNTSRFISSMVLGYGDHEANSVSVETYYNGKEIKNLFKQNDQSTNVTSNLSGTWKLTKNWFWNASVGKTFVMKDTSNRDANDDFAASIGTKYRLTKLRTEIQAKMKRVGNTYDGFSQGIYNSGFTKIELGIQTKLTKTIQLQVVGIRQSFSSKNENFRGMTTTSGTVDMQWNVTRRFTLFGGYTLLQAAGQDTVAKGFNHLGKAGFTWVKRFKNTRAELTGLGALSNINRIDSNMRMINSSIHGVLDWAILGAGLQVQFQDYNGLAQIYGQNWIIKPEFKVHYKGITANIAYHYLRSQQFGEQSGFSARVSASPSEYVTWELTGAKWLPTEAIYIPLYGTKQFIPYYFDIKLRVFLNRTK